MKKHLAVLCLTAVLAAALLLASCGKKPEAAGAATGTPPPAATPSPAPLPLRVLQPYNSRAWYVEKIDMEQDKWVLHPVWISHPPRSRSCRCRGRMNTRSCWQTARTSTPFIWAGRWPAAAVYRGDPDTAAW